MKTTEIKSSAQESSPAETRERVLDAAEQLFAQYGVEAVSIRDITRAAKVNLAAINYHFGTKQSLMAAVFNRWLGPLNERRLELLDALEQKADGKPIKPEAILEALIRPAVEQGFEAKPGHKFFLQLIGRCLGVANAEIEPLIRAQFDRLLQRFNAALLRPLPKLSEEELFWRMKFIFGALHHTLLTCGKTNCMPAKMRKHLNAEELIRRLIAFSAAVLKTGLAK
ncbi:MAG: TetR/AcrR family transcriptional regulator [Limisphaerales bacterium]